MSGAKVDFLPCPFCNGAAEFYVRFDSQAIGWSDGLGSPGTHTTRFEGVRCTKCRARMDTDSKRESVVSAWNLRALSAEVERLEREKEALRDVIKAHNDGCQSLCGYGELEATLCGYRPYFLASGRRCPNCPTDDMIEMPK